MAGSAFLGRQKDLVEAYADEMTYHVGDEREMMLCDKEYKGKVGPGLYRETMFKVRAKRFPAVVTIGYGSRVSELWVDLRRLRWQYMLGKI